MKTGSRDHRTRPFESFLVTQNCRRCPSSHRLNCLIFSGASLMVSAPLSAVAVRSSGTAAASDAKHLRGQRGQSVSLPTSASRRREFHAPIWPIATVPTEVAWDLKPAAMPGPSSMVKIVRGNGAADGPHVDADPARGGPVRHVARRFDKGPGCAWLRRYPAKSIFGRTRSSPPTFRQRNNAGSHQDNNNDGGKRLHRCQCLVQIVPKLKHALAPIESAPAIDKATLSK